MHYGTLFLLTSADVSLPWLVDPTGVGYGEPRAQHLLVELCFGAALQHRGMHRRLGYRLWGEFIASELECC